MSGIIHSIDWWWNYFKGLFNVKSFSITGTITLAAGVQEISVPTTFPNPDSIFLSVSEPPDSITTCVGDINWAAARLAENGFVLFADIKSDSCKIDYIVQYKFNATNPTVK